MRKINVNLLHISQSCKTRVSTCFYCNLQILTFIFVILLGLYKY